jgi:hypothetical protein
MATKKKSTKKAAAGDAAKKAPAKKATTKKTATAKSVESVVVSPEDYYKMVQEAAYFQAEADGFSKDPSDYWLEAEKEIQKRLSGR